MPGSVSVGSSRSWNLRARQQGPQTKLPGCLPAAARRLVGPRMSNLVDSYDPAPRLSDGQGGSAAELLVHGHRTQVRYLADWPIDGTEVVRGKDWLKFALFDKCGIETHYSASKGDTS
ncbi:unnamed protein product [Gadus morhua 'NCC']